MSKIRRPPSRKQRSTWAVGGFFARCRRFHFGQMFALEPGYAGAKDDNLGVIPIFRVHRAGSADQFRSPIDSPSMTLLGLGDLRAGLVASYVPVRIASRFPPFTGLGDVARSFGQGAGSHRGSPQGSIPMWSSPRRRRAMAAAAISRASGSLMAAPCSPGTPRSMRSTRFGSSMAAVCSAGLDPRLFRVAGAPAQWLLGRSSARLGQRAHNRGRRHHPSCARPSPAQRRCRSHAALAVTRVARRTRSSP
jgi:hypothetical protein